MSLRDKLGEYVPLLARKTALPRVQSLALKPVRNPTVTWTRRETEDDLPTTVALSVPIRKTGLTRTLTRLFAMPGSKTVELDEFGSEIWEICDGRHTVEQFVGHTCRKYQLNRRQAEVSVLAFMRMLLERRLIGFIEATTQGEEHVSSTHRPASGRKRRGRARHRY